MDPKEIAVRFSNMAPDLNPGREYAMALAAAYLAEREERAALEVDKANAIEMYHVEQRLRDKAEHRIEEMARDGAAVSCALGSNLALKLTATLKEEVKDATQHLIVLTEANLGLRHRVAELEGLLREAVKIVRGAQNICSDGDRAVAYGVQKRIEHALAAAGKPGGGA